MSAIGLLAITFNLFDKNQNIRDADWPQPTQLGSCVIRSLGAKKSGHGKAGDVREDELLRVCKSGGFGRY